MKKLASVAWLRIERIPDLVADLTIPAVLIVSGLLVMGLALVS